MCGIAGIISTNGIEKGHLAAMSAALQHRGPDGYGYMLYSELEGVQVWLNEEISDYRQELDTVGFAHRRLSIIDLSAANSQPMVDESGTYCVVHNGEIYNYIELRKELENLGYSFKTTGDVEVLLRAYEAWGPACMEKFNGMWAFALLDTRNQCVILSRDRFGIKPLYYTIQDNSIYFASEIKGLLAIPSIDREPNQRIVAKYLLTGLLDDTEETFFEGIYQLPAAHWAKIPLKTGTLTISPKPYWSFPTTAFQGTEKDAIEQFRKLLLDAVRIHARSDVPVGTCLSGGLDSSSIVCASELLRKKDLIPSYSHTAFGYCPAKGRWSEREYMNVVARATSVSMHYVAVSQEDFENTIPRIIQEQDEPFGSASIVAQWFVFERAKKEGMTVMLDGQGGDETLAGYHHYFATIALDLLHRRRIMRYLALRSRYEKVIGEFPLPYRLLSLRTIISVIPSSLVDLLRPLIWLAKRRSRRISIAKSRGSPFTEALIEQCLAEQSAPRRRRTLNEELQAQVQSSSLPALLRYEDRNSMAHSIEARVPFLDYRLVELLFRLPQNLKINGVTTKYILREAMKGILPESIRTRKDKIGFKADPALTFSFLRKHSDDLLCNKTCFEERWFAPHGIEALLNRCDQSSSDEFLLWRILNMKLWLHHHWNGD